VAVWKQTAAYGVNAFVASMANTSLEQSPSIVIGRMQGAASVGYYNLPLRILMYAADAVSRVGIVASAQAAEFSAKGRFEAVAKLGIYANRYCFTLYAPLAMVVLVYGRELIQLWVGREYVLNSAPLLPVMVIGTAFTTAGQFTSSSLLFGMGKHRDYAYFLLAEAAANIAGLILVIPRYGLMGAAVVAVSLMTLIRGIITPWLVCRQLHFPYFLYMRSIFFRPLITALPVLALLYWLKWNVWPGTSWLQLIAVSGIAGILYYGAAYFSCLEDEHKSLLWNAVLKLWRRVSPARPSF
jgi:O-antigen/teichoic acid export membrane protein